MGFEDRGLEDGLNGGHGSRSEGLRDLGFVGFGDWWIGIFDD